MKIIKRLAQGILVAFALVLVPGPALSIASAEGAEVLQVSGTFQTLSLECPGVPPGTDCVIDSFFGDLVGTDQLITVYIIENQNTWTYLDDVIITTQYGTFTGTERGVIDAATGDFHSTSHTESTDGCGSMLELRVEGNINLETFQDSGTYEGTLILKECE